MTESSSTQCRGSSFILICGRDCEISDWGVSCDAGGGDDEEGEDSGWEERAARDFSVTESRFWFILPFSRLPVVVSETSSVVGRSTDTGIGELDFAEKLRGSLSGVFGESSGSGIWFSSADKISSESDRDLRSTDLGDIFGERTGRGLSAAGSED